MLNETWIGINFLESFRIVDGMVVVDRVRASAGKTRVRAWDLGDSFIQYQREGNRTLKVYPEVLQEDCVVTSRAERPDTDAVNLLSFGLCVQRISPIVFAKKLTTIRGSVPKSALGIGRVGYILGDFAEEMCKQRRSVGLEF
jgi:hypothetical protein